MCWLEWSGRLKCWATGLDASLPFLSTSRGRSRKRSPSLLTVSPMYIFFIKVHVMQWITFAKVQVQRSVILIDRWGPVIKTGPEWAPSFSEVKKKEFRRSKLLFKVTRRLIGMLMIYGGGDSRGMIFWSLRNLEFLGAFGSKNQEPSSETPHRLANEKQWSVKTSSAKRSSVSELGSLILRCSKKTFVIRNCTI